MWTTIANKLCWFIVGLFPKRVWVIHASGEPYLLRFYIKHGGRLPGVYLHHFFREDLDRELHNHPWKSSVSVILTGGYVEERLMPNKSVKYFMVFPFSLNRINHDDFHRIDWLARPVWTIFISGKKSQSWGFWDRDNDQYMDHRDYLGIEDEIVE